MTHPSTSPELSACCNAPIKTHYADEGTGCWVCLKCERACNLATPADGGKISHSVDDSIDPWSPSSADQSAKTTPPDLPKPSAVVVDAEGMQKLLEDSFSWAQRQVRGICTCGDCKRFCERSEETKKKLGEYIHTLESEHLMMRDGIEQIEDFTRSEGGEAHTIAEKLLHSLTPRP
jgi:hypothetical protein